MPFFWVGCFCVLARQLVHRRSQKGGARTSRRWWKSGVDIAKGMILIALVVQVMHLICHWLHCRRRWAPCVNIAEYILSFIGMPLHFCGRQGLGKTTTSQRNLRHGSLGNDYELPCPQFQNHLRVPWWRIWSSLVFAQPTVAQPTANERSIH